MDKFLLSPNKKTVFIMGAGASKDDDIPIQNEILEKILKGDFAYKGKNSIKVAKEYNRVSSQVKKLVSAVFGKNAAKALSLESLFNILETSLSQRQNIGAIDLREVKQYYRDLIQGIMYVTRTNADVEKHNVKNFLNKKTKISSPYTAMGVKIFKRYKSNTANFSFINFNYDICLDRVLLSMQDKNPEKSFDLDYGIELGNYSLDEKHKFWFGKPRKRGVYLLRPHGSVNWLFCRSCGQVFSKLTMQNKTVDIREGTKCYLCKLSNLEPYIVYPSYNRIYENKHLIKIWMYIEELLAEADQWCFIGYSLPDADKYFTYVLTKIYNYRKAVRPLPEVSVVNINKAVKKQAEIISALTKCDNSCGGMKEAKNYFADIMREKDIFSRFGIYFNDVVKYECSFDEFTKKYFFVE